MKYIKTKNGKTKCVLTPSERSRKFAKELRIGAKFTNDGLLKCDENGPIKLDVEDKAFRYGYLYSRKDNADAYKASLKKSNQ